jgi:predicted NACHT family NTPase
MEGKLRQALVELYRAQSTIPKLIEDESIPEQSMDEYYVKL